MNAYIAYRIYCSHHRLSRAAQREVDERMGQLAAATMGRRRRNAQRIRRARHALTFVLHQRGKIVEEATNALRVDTHNG